VSAALCVSCKEYLHCDKKLALVAHLLHQSKPVVCCANTEGESIPLRQRGDRSIVLSEKEAIAPPSGASGRRWGWPMDPLCSLGLRGCKSLPLIGIGIGGGSEYGNRICDANF